MATKAKNEVAVRQNTTMASWQEEAARDAQEAAESEVSGGKFISIAGGMFQFDGKQLPNPLSVVVLDSIHENAFYAGRYDPDNKQGPVCFAFSRKGGDDMAPHDNSSEKQNPTCKGCPRNEWGSADTGAGKACKNIRRLALMMPAQLSDVGEAQVAYMKLPVTSAPIWGSYVKGLESSLKRAPYGVVTSMKIVPDPKTQYKLNFSVVEPIDLDKHFAALKDKRAKVQGEIMSPYTTRAEEEKAPAKNAKPSVRKYARK